MLGRVVVFFSSSQLCPAAKFSAVTVNRFSMLRCQAFMFRGGERDDAAEGLISEFENSCAFSVILMLLVSFFNDEFDHFFYSFTRPLMHIQAGRS